MWISKRPLKPEELPLICTIWRSVLQSLLLKKRNIVHYLITNHTVASKKMKNIYSSLTRKKVLIMWCFKFKQALWEEILKASIILRVYISHRKARLARDSVKWVRALKLNWLSDINRPLASLTSDTGRHWNQDQEHLSVILVSRTTWLKCYKWKGIESYYVLDILGFLGWFSFSILCSSLLWGTAML